MKKQINMWLTALKEAKPVNYTSETDWQMETPQDNVISRARILVI